MRSDRVDGIRLGPDRKSAGSLPAQFQEAEADLVLTADWRAIADTARLNHLECSVLAALRRGVQPQDLFRVLRRSPVEAARAYRSLMHKLRLPASEIAGFTPIRNSRWLAYRERFQSGYRPWALTPLDESFVEIMSAEKTYCLSSQADTAKTQDSRRFCPVSNERRIFMTDIELDNKIAAARKRLTELAELHSTVAQEASDLERELTASEAAAKSEREVALIEARDVNEPIVKRPLSIRSKLQAAQQRTEAAAGAVRRQREILAGFESEAEATKYSQLMNLVRARVPEIVGLQDRMNNIFLEIVDASRKANRPLFTNEIFPDERENIAHSRLAQLNMGLHVIRAQMLWSTPSDYETLPAISDPRMQRPPDPPDPEAIERERRKFRKFVLGA